MKECIIAANSSKAIKWIDVLKPEREELTQLAEEYNLHRYTVQDSLEPDHLPKFETIDNVKFIITRLYLPKEGKASTIQEITSKIAIFYTEDFIITIHRAEWHFLEGMKEKFKKVKEPITTTKIVTQLLWQVVNTYDQPADNLIQQVEGYETRIFLKELIPGLQQDIYYLKRKAETCKRMLTFTTEVIALTHLGEKNNPYLQDLRDLHLKLLTKYEQVLSNVNNLLNIYISLSAQKTGEVMKVLTIFSAFFMPLTFIVGIYGMNFNYMPELEKHWGYGAIWVLMLIVSAVIFLWFRRKRWL